MSRKTTKPAKDASSGEAKPAPAVPAPVDVADGIPDRAARPSWRRLLWVIAIFAAWLAFLIYVKVSGEA